MLSTHLLEMACVVDAVLAGTHDLTVEGLVYLRDKLDASAALATAMERDANDRARFRARYPVGSGNVVPFPGRTR